MANVCPSCGKENRDQARFCRGCARPLDRPGGDAASDEVARERASRALRRARRRKSSPSPAARPAWSRWGSAMLVGVLTLAIGWWLGARQTTPAPARAAPLSAAPAVAAPGLQAPAGTVPSPVPAVSVGDAPTPPAADTAAAVDRLRHSVELLEQQDRERAAAQAQQRQKLALEQKRLDDARRRTEATSAAAAGAHSAAPEPVPVAVATPAPSAPVAAAAVAPAARSAVGVDQLCAGSDNVFARDFCRIRECGKAAFANDPVCVRFRQMDEARRREAEYR